MNWKPAEQTDKNFIASVAFTIFREVGNSPNGGYTNDPHDPGGETKWGISKRYHPNIDILKLDRHEAERIYYLEYWLASGADRMPWPYCLAVFDSCVIPGIGATRLFIRAAEQDQSKIPFTKAMIVCNAREAYFRGRVAKSPEKERYIRGWVNRINATRKECAKPAP